MMATDGDLLLRAILDNPAEDTPRLMYADWLDEQGRGEWQRDHAALIRWQIRTGIKYRRSLVRKKWVNESRREPSERRGPDVWRALNSFLSEAWANDFVVAKGFVCGMTCPAAWWLTHGDDLLTRHPVERVRLTTWPRMRIQTMRAMIEDKVGLEDDPQRKMFGATEVARKAQQFDGHWIAAVLALRWPGVTFQLPESSPINVSWATSDSNPLADIIAYRERLIREAGGHR